MCFGTAAPSSIPCHHGSQRASRISPPTHTQPQTIARTSRRAGTWAMVELVKLALDAKKPDAAKMAAQELNGLFEFDQQGSGRSHVRGGQLVLSGWLDYLTDKKDERDPADLSSGVGDTTRHVVRDHCGAWLAERGAAPFSRWDSAGDEDDGIEPCSGTLELSGYIDRAQLAALALSHGTLPPSRRPGDSIGVQAILASSRRGRQGADREGDDPQARSSPRRSPSGTPPRMGVWPRNPCPQKRLEAIRSCSPRDVGGAAAACR